MVYDVHKDSHHNIVLSKQYYYDRFGNNIGYSILGLCSLPVRSSFNDDYNLSYYKIYTLGNFVKCVNEFGEEDYIQQGKMYVDNKGVWSHIPPDIPSLVYLRITSLHSVAYLSGLRDNDILLHIGSWNNDYKNRSTTQLDKELCKIGNMPMTIMIARLVNDKFLLKKIQLRPMNAYAGLDYTVFYIKSRSYINRIKNL